MGRLFAMLHDPLTWRTERACLRGWRRAVLAAARGTVVEIGAGTGRSLDCYPPQGIERLLLTEPDLHMQRRLARRVAGAQRDAVEVVGASAGALPCDDGSIDCVVTSLVLCSVPDLDAALQEAVRVLRPGGALLFLEHVAAPPDSRLRHWQQRVEPVWRRVAAGCRLTRETGEAISAAGLRIERLTAGRMHPAPAVVQPAIRGLARKPQ